MNKKRFGIQIDDSGDISVGSNGMRLGDTMAQNQYILMLAHPGDIKEFPTLGAGIADMAGSNGVAVCKRKIREAFRADGMDIKAFEMQDDGKITRLEASYR